MIINITDIVINPPIEMINSPIQYRAIISISEQDKIDHRSATISVVVDVKEHTTIEEIKEMALIKAKEFLEESMSHF
jgi:predicted nucleotidyltransferase